MEELHGDITQLNSFVVLTRDQLVARGEITTDLLPNLFKGYLSCKDKNFREYMELKQQNYDEGTVYTPEELMVLAANKYKTLVKAGKWMALSPEEEKIVALEAKLKSMSKKQNTSTSTDQSNKNTSQTNAGSGKQGRNQRSSKKKDIPQWKLKFPGQSFVSSNQHKMKDGRKYYWCTKHRMFTIHKSSECRLREPIDRSNASGTTTGSSNQTNTNSSDQNQDQAAPSLRISTATMMNE